MTSPGIRQVDLHTRDTGQTRPATPDSVIADMYPSASFKRTWWLIQSLLGVAFLCAFYDRMLGNDEITRHNKLVSVILGSLPTVLLSLAALIILYKVVTSRRVIWWFICGIGLGLLSNGLNLMERMSFLRNVPLLGSEGAFHGITETAVELTGVLVFFLAFAKSVLTLREMTDLAERRSATLQEDARLRAQLQDGLITERNDARWLTEKLEAVNAATMVLSESTGVYDLCRRAVVLGRCQLGFDRLGIWLFGEKTGQLYGTYGVDESGQIRDERNSELLFLNHHPNEVEILRSGKPLIRTSLSPLRNHQGEIVGKGDHAIAALWDGDSVVGEITTDNLLSEKPISPVQLQLLGVYANVLGHLLTQKRLEESLSHAQQIEERLHALLADLHQVTLELAMAETVDDLCREGVRAGKARLGFTRVEIRLISENTNILHGTYGTGENGRICDLSESTWEISSLEPVCAEAMTGAKRPVSACPLGGFRPRGLKPGQACIWRQAVPLGTLEKVFGLLIMEHLLPNENLSSANLEIAFLFGETLSHLINGKLQEEQRHKWADQLAQTQRLESLGTLAGGIAHDFNNILGAMIGFSEMALAETPEDSGIRDMQEQVLRAGFRAKELVRQILNFSRRTAIGSSEPILPHLIVKEALKLIRASLPATIRIHTDIQPDCGYVVAEPTHIHQVVINLCTNAYQAMREKGNLLEVSLSSVDLLEPSPDLGIPAGQYIRLMVQDNGIGMDYETLRHANEPFFTTKPAGEGTGLGLSTVQGIARSLGGALQITSTKGEGTSVEVFFPQCPPIEPQETGPVQQPICGFTDRHVLVVDDEVAVCLVATKQLERLKQLSTSTTSSLEALDLFRKQPDLYDLILTDYTMPDMAGLELAEAIHAIRPDLPIIMMSGNLDPRTDVEREQAAGILEVLEKPVALRDLARCLNRVFAANIASSTAPEWPSSTPAVKGMPG